jgi:hypothetical protein
MLIALIASVVLILVAATGALLSLVFDLRKRLDSSERFLYERLVGHFPERPARSGRWGLIGRLLVGAAVVLVVVLVACVAVLIVEMRPSWTTIAVSVFALTTSVSVAWVTVRIINIKKAQKWLAASALLGLFLSASATATIAGHVTVKPMFKIQGEAYLHLSNSRLKRFESKSFALGKDCRDPAEEKKLRETIYDSIPPIRHADVVFVVGQVDRRRLARPQEEWVRTDLELAQARAACARKFIRDSLPPEIPVYIQVGGPSYLEGNDEHEFERDRTVAIFAFTSKVDTVSVALDSAKVRVFPIY